MSTSPLFDKMRTQYNCIGGFIDLDGLSLIRFDLDGDKFKVLASRSISYMPPLREIPRLILQLAAVADDVAIAQIDLLTNFGSALKNSIPLATNDGKTITRQTTQAVPIVDLILTLRSLISEERLHVKNDDRTVLACLQQVRGIKQETLKSIYEGNASLDHALQAVLHSVAVLELRRASPNGMG